ncbi:hypothetical protein AVEN_230276-1 [Araneus ventricosus]|uniref:Uncharacterized protein n=1 Tax=Araneus ventricosus TaxID=182803 RepID=A0A4Y2W3R7_ARAVE|nr:hypothetical protein AVEN_230276-1 [Araneus ventricosus]
MRYRNPATEPETGRRVGNAFIRQRPTSPCQERTWRNRTLANGGTPSKRCVRPDCLRVQAMPCAKTAAHDMRINQIFYKCVVRKIFAHLKHYLKNFRINK